jgi:DNA-directed RNA polymerase subunit RPC12/RpoP
MSYQIWSLDRGDYETRGRHAPTEIAYWIWTSPGEDQSDPPQETSNLTLTPPGDHYNCWSTDSNNNHWPVATRRGEREELDFNQFCGDAVAVPGSSEFGYDRIWRTTCTGVYHEDISLDNRSSRLYDGRLQGSVVELVANQTAREYRCSHCKDGFRSISNRRRHEISVHGGAISCPYCQKPIGRRADYRKKHARACKAFPRGVF